MIFAAATFFLPFYSNCLLLYLHQLTTSEEQLKKLQFFKSVVAPLVESYWVAACGLLWLRNQTFSGISQSLVGFIIKVPLKIQVTNKTLLQVRLL